MFSLFDLKRGSVGFALGLMDADFSLWYACCGLCFSGRLTGSDHQGRTYGLSANQRIPVLIVHQ